MLFKVAKIIYKMQIQSVLVVIDIKISYFDNYVSCLADNSLLFL